MLKHRSPEGSEQMLLFLPMPLAVLAPLAVTLGTPSKDSSEKRAPPKRLGMGKSNEGSIQDTHL